MVDARRSLPPLTAVGAYRTSSRARGKRHGRITMTDAAVAAAHASDVPGLGDWRRESRFTTRGNNNCLRAPTRHNFIILLFYYYVARRVCILRNM